MAKLLGGTRIYGNATVDTNLTVGGSTLQYGKLTVDVPTASTSATTGALVVTGGVGVGGNIFANGIVDITSTRASTSTSTGALVVDGGAGIAGNVHSANLTATFGLYGTVRTAAQTTITSVGTLTSLAVSGTITVNSGAAATAIINGATTGVGNIGSSTVAFNTVFAKASSAQYADLAEVYTSDLNYIPGTVVVFGGTSEVTVSLISHDPAVAGVVSTNPAYLMNDAVEGAAVALQGRVPCRVLGPVSKGDRVVASDVRGVAERLDMSKYQPGCIIGKALDSVPDGEIATIEVVVGRN